MPLSPEMLRWHILAAHGRKVPAIVRIPGPNLVGSAESAPWGTYIKHALDSNADGVVVPQIRTAADVRSVVGDCRYPTGGQRLAPFNQAFAASPVRRPRLATTVTS